MDSGAGCCVFDAQIGELLGIDVEAGEKEYVGGITGSLEIYYSHEVILSVGGYSQRTRAGFLRNIARLGYGIVGQRGFFDLFIVKFDLMKGEIEVVPR